MKSLDVLKDLEITDNDIIKLVYSIDLVKFKKDEVLFKRGDRGDYFYILLTGQVDVFLPNPEVKQDQIDLQDLIR